MYLTIKGKRTNLRKGDEIIFYKSLPSTPITVGFSRDGTRIEFASDPLTECCDDKQIIYLHESCLKSSVWSITGLVASVAGFDIKLISEDETKTIYEFV